MIISFMRSLTHHLIKIFCSFVKSAAEERNPLVVLPSLPKEVRFLCSLPYNYSDLDQIKIHILTIIITFFWNFPHIQIEVVGPRQYKLITLSSEGTALHSTRVIVILVIELSDRIGRVNGVQDRGLTPAESQDVRASRVEANAHTVLTSAICASVA